tara:strand:- start:3770 stop:4576 length:807 start_codon:yes stop_codon:yes gene_type:complete
MQYDYNLSDLNSAYKKLNLKKNDVIYITGNLVALGKYSGKNILHDKLKVIQKILGKRCTISFPTHSFRLINNNKLIFDVKKTNSETGSFSEYLRKQKGCYRQFHPYSSTSSIGKHAKYICSNNSRHVYGPDSPFDKLIKLNCKFIGFGLEPGYTAAQVHHLEYMQNVPYRYTKSFNQKIKYKNTIKQMEFYLFVMYKKFYKYKRDRNRKIFNNFKKKNHINVVSIGKNKIYSYSLKDFYLSTLDLIKKDPYCWLPDEVIKKYKLGKGS